MAKSKKDDADPSKRATRYSDIVSKIFSWHYKKGMTEFEFERSEIPTAAEELGIILPKNLGDVIYSFRFRTVLPEEIVATAPPKSEWVIMLAGRGNYKMKLVRISRIAPSPDKYEIKIPDATPQIVVANALGDEQALLAKVRYNRLIDTFLRLTAYSLQSHLRTTVPDMGQIETDEIYVGVRNTGQQFVIPVQAKGGTDQLGIVQVQQDVALCNHAFPHLTARPVAVQFKKVHDGDVIVMFELVQDGEELKVIDEKHYRLVPASAISDSDLETMANAGD